MKYIPLIFILFCSIYFFAYSGFAYNENDIDLYNHSNQHAVIFKAIDKRENYKNIEYQTIKLEKCGKAEYKTIKKVAKKLKEKEQPFWVYKYCKYSLYKYNTANIIDAYNNYRFDLQERLLSYKEHHIKDNIVSYLPINLQKGSNYLYYLGMRNNLIEWENDNNSLHITLPIIFNGLITNMSVEKDSVLVKEIYVYDRPSGLSEITGYKNLFEK